MGTKWVVRISGATIEPHMEMFDDEKAATAAYEDKIKKGLPQGHEPVDLYLEHNNTAASPARKLHEIIKHYRLSPDGGNDLSRIVQV